MATLRKASFSKHLRDITNTEDTIEENISIQIFVQKMKKKKVQEVIRDFRQRNEINAFVAI